MPTSQLCFPVVRGRAARFTRVDNCGCPAASTCNNFVTEDITGVTISPQLDEPEEITLRNIAGKICVSDRPCDSVRWFNVTITLCKVIPALYQLTSGYTTVKDHNGQTVGYGIASNIDCDGGFGLEIWGDTPGQVCTPGATSGQYDYLVIPWVSAATLSGDIEVGNSARQPVLSGRTKTGHCWGKGPYNVQAQDDTGVCGPLIDPIPANMHLWDLLVGCPPPEPKCECNELEVFCSVQRWNTDNTGQASTDGTCIRLRWNALGPVTLTRFTGETPVQAAASGDGIYCYIAPQNVGGTINTITVALQTGGTTPCVTTYQIPPQPTVVEGVDNMTADVTVENNGSGSAEQVIIDWGDGSATETNPGDATTVTSHTYTDPGTYTITVCDVASPDICNTETVTIPFP